MMRPGGRDLVQVARLRAEIASFARGGEYELATALLQELTATDLRSGLVADALRRSRQAAFLARQGSDIVEELRAELLLAVSLIAAGDPRAGAAAANTVRVRADQVSENDGPHLSAVAHLVLGIALRRDRGRAAARASLHACRARAARLGRADLTALALAELGALDLDEGDPDAAAVCFSFARDAFRLVGREHDAGVAAIAALRGFLDAGRADDAATLALDTIEDAGRRRDLETAARAAAVHADARIAAGDAAAAQAAADDAAARAAALKDPARRELLVAARLRQLRLERDPAQQQLHLEAAFDLGLSGRDAGAIAGALDWAVEALVDGALPHDAWQVVAALSRAMRESGFPRIADVADAALAELR